MLHPETTSRILQIGAGGVGGPIAQSLAMIADELTIADGDEFEAKNNSRQPFSRGKEGINKAVSMAEDLKAKDCKIQPYPEFIKQANLKQVLDAVKPTLIVLCVDNDEARKLIFAERENYPILWGANEQWDPQAGLTTPTFCWNPMEYFAPADGNNGGADGCGIQTIHANIAAAAMAINLLHTWLAPQESPRARLGKLPCFVAQTEGGLYQLMSMTFSKTPSSTNSSTGTKKSATPSAKSGKHYSNKKPAKV